ncbi:hypothetical protein EII20_10105, partial [Comamonadaceae bacterium OH2545_COT-014]
MHSHVKPRRARLTLLAAAGLLALPAAAQNVLLLSTAEAGYAQTGYIDRIAKAYTDAGATVTHQAGLLNDGTALDPALFANQDMVVVASVQKTVDDADLQALETAVRTRASDRLLSFVFITDGCCDSAALKPHVGAETFNVTRVKDMLNRATGWNLGLQRYYAAPPAVTSLALNAGSPYSAHFTGANINPTLRGHDYLALTDTPAANAVYLHTGISSPQAAGATTAYTVFAPREQVNGGAGACVMLTGDANPFENSPLQGRQLAEASLKLRLSDTCKLPQTITVPAQAPVPPFAANATYALNGVTGGASGQPLQYASTTPGVCTVDANTGVVTMLATGNC